MAVEPPRRFSGLALAVVLAAVIIGAAIYTSSFGVTTHTVTETKTSTVTTAVAATSVSTTIQSSTNNTIRSCSTTPESVGTYLYLVSNSGQPISDVSVLASPVLNGTCYGQSGFETLLTDLAGRVSIGTLEGGAYFAISVARFGYTYNFTIPQESLDVSNVTLSLPSGSLRTTVCYGTACTTSSGTAIIAQVVTTSQSSAQTTAGFAFTTNAVLITHFCTNTTAIPTNGAAGLASDLKFSGSGINGSSLIQSVTNDGTSPVSIQAICIEGAGIDANSTTLGLVISPSNPVQPGQVATITARFNEGTTVYALPLRTIEFTLIAGVGSKASDGIPVCCGVVTTPSQTPLISIIQGMTLQSGSYLGKYPELTAAVNFNASVPAETLEVDINGTYIGTVSIDTNFVHFSAQFAIGIIDPDFGIQAGARYSITLLVTYQGFTTSAVTETVVATS